MMAYQGPAESWTRREVSGLALVEHGADHELGAPVVVREPEADGHDAVGDLVGERLALGSEGAQQDRHVDGPGREELRELAHLHRLAVDLDDLAVEQAPQLAQELARLA